MFCQIDGVKGSGNVGYFFQLVFFEKWEEGLGYLVNVLDVDQEVGREVVFLEVLVFVQEELMD